MWRGDGGVGRSESGENDVIVPYLPFGDDAAVGDPDLQVKIWVITSDRKHQRAPSKHVH